MEFRPATHGSSRNVYADRQTGVATFFRDVYAWMAAGVGLSGLVAYYTAQSPGMLRAIYGNPMSLIVLAVLPLGIGIYFQRNAARMTTFAAGNLFFAYASLMGLLLSSALVVYTGASVGRAFFVASATFAGAAAYGSTTKRELSQAQQFLMMGLIGVLVASVLNIFLRSAAIEWVVSMAMVVTFSGMTAWDHQALKRMHAYQGTAGNVALVGAFALYVNFVNLFMAFLRLTGQRRDD